MHCQENTRVENNYNGRKTISEFPKHLYLVCRNQKEEKKQHLRQLKETINAITDLLLQLTAIQEQIS